MLVPTNVSATLLVNSPDTPKSQILMWPAELSRMLLGLTSGSGGKEVSETFSREKKAWGQLLTAMHDLVHLVEISQAGDHG